MERMLKERVEEKAENYERNVLGKSLKEIKTTNNRLKNATTETLNELIDEYLSTEDGEDCDISPLLQVYD